MAKYISGAISLVDPTPSDTGFFERIVVSETYTAVGQWGSGGARNVYVYDSATGNYVTVVAATDLEFGKALDISGDYLMVGAPTAESNGEALAGRVKIYHIPTSQLIVTIENPNAFGAGLGDEFGFDIAMDGNYAIIGTHSEDDGFENSGKAYIFGTTTGDWTDVALLHTLDNPNLLNTRSWDRFGSAVTIDGTTAGVSAPADGYVHLYDVITGNLITNITVAVSGLHSAISMSGNKLAVGSAGYNSGGVRGAAYIYETTLGDWTDTTLITSLYNPNPDGGLSSDSFAQSIKLAGSLVLIGAGAESLDAPNSGVAYLYTADGNLLHRFDNPNSFSTPDGDTFGSSISISPSYIGISAPYEDATGKTTTGAAYLYSYDMTTEPFNDTELSVFSDTVVATVVTNDDIIYNTNTFQLVGGPYAQLDYFNSDGSFSFTPSSCFIGDYTFQYNITDYTGYTSTSATVTISCVEPKPTLVPDTYTNTDTEQTAGNVSTNDICVQPGYTFDLVSNPSGLTNLNPDGTFTFTPSNCFVGDYVFSYRIRTPVYDRTSTTTTVTITCSDPRPVSTNDSFTSNDWAIVNGNVSTNDPCYDVGDVFEIVGVAPPELTTFNSDGSFVFTPVYPNIGDYSFQYKINPAVGSDSNTSTVTVTVADYLPILVDDAYTSDDWVVINGDVSTNDSTISTAHPLSSYTYEILGTLPPELTSFFADGTFSFTPVWPNVTAFVLQYRITDGIYTSPSKNITITVSDNYLPTFGDDTYTSDDWAVVAADLSTNDSTISTNYPLSAYTYQITGTPPTQFDFLNANGTFQVTPTFPDVDPYTFTYDVIGGGVVVASKTATINITPYFPVAVNDTYSSTDWAVVNSNVTNNDINFTSNYTTVIVGASPAELTTFNSDGAIVVTPVWPDVDPITFQYKITRDAWESNVANVTVSVVTTPVIARNDSYVNINSVTTFGTVATNDTYQPEDTFVLVSDPLGFIDFFNSDGTFSLTPVFPYLGNYQFTYKILDAVSLLYPESNNAIVTVNCVRSAITIASDSFVSENWVPVVETVGANDTYIVGVDTFELFSDPLNAIVYFNSDGTFQYDVPYPTIGNVTFQYRIKNGYTGDYTSPITVTIDSQFTNDLSQYDRLLAQAGGDDLALFLKFPFIRNSADMIGALDARLAADQYYEQDTGTLIGDRRGTLTQNMNTPEIASLLINWFDDFMDYNTGFIPRSILEVVDLTYWNDIPSMKPAEITLSAPSLDPVNPYYAAYNMADPEFWSMGISEINGVNVTTLLESAYTNTSDVSWYAPDPTVSRSGWSSQGITEWARTTEVTDYYINNGSYTGYVYPIHQTCNNSASVMSCNESTYFMDPLDGCLYSYYGLSSPRLPGYLFSDEYFHYRLSPTGIYHDYEEPRVGSATYVKSDGIVTSDHFITAPTDATFTDDIGNVNIVLDTNGNLIEPATVNVISELPSIRHTSRSLKTNVVSTGSRRYKYEFQYAPMTKDDAGSLLDSVDRYKGKANHFYMPIPNVAALGVNTLYKEAGNTDNTVVVYETVHPTTGETSGAKGDNTVVLFNCPVTYFPAGLLLRFSNQEKLYKTTVEATRAAEGSVKLKFDPPLSESVDNQSLVLRESYDNFDGTHNLVRVRLDEDFLEYSVNGSGLVVVKLKFVEDIV